MDGERFRVLHKKGILRVKQNNETQRERERKWEDEENPEEIKP